MPSRRWRALVAVGAAFALALAGCGGDDEPAAGGGEAGPTKLKVQETAGVPSAFVGFGIKKGFFERHRLQIQLEATQGGAATIPALVSGDIQVGGSNVVSVLLAASKGLPLQVIAPGTSAHSAGEEDFGALLVAKDGDVNEAGDLEGRTVAVNTLDNIAEVVVKAALEKEGVDVSGIKLVEVPFPEMWPAVEKGRADAAFNIEPFVTSSVREGAKVINYSYVVTEPNMQVGAYVVTKQFAEENADTVKRYSDAVAETAEYVTDNQDEFRTFLSEQAKVAPALAKRLVLPQFTTRINAASLERTAGLMQKYGLSDKPVSTDALLAGAPR
jgi:NitT/TauT family transport system substrate-binding protein